MKLALVSIVLCLTTVQAFVVKQFNQNHLHYKLSPMSEASALSMSPTSLMPTVAQTISSVIQSGTYGVLGLAAVSSAVLLPLTQIKTQWGISVGYGGSVAAIALVLMRVLPPCTPLAQALVASAAFYGVRLALFLLARDLLGYKPLRAANRPETPRLGRIPFATSLALFYGFMTTPLLYAMRAEVLTSLLSKVGVGLAWTGAVLEAVADFHKIVVKNKGKKSDDFSGPFGGVYRITRHPNYTGEVVFWTGILIAGLPTFGKSIAGYVSSLLGYVGIIKIMTGANASLEKRQGENYGGQDAYETWKKDVPYPLIPFVKG